MSNQDFEMAAKALPVGIRRWSILLLVLTVLAGASVAWAQSAPPIIFFTDLTTVPNTGGESVNDFSGAYVTLYGNFFGATQGTSTVTLNGANCLRVVSWGGTWQWYQRIVVQLGSSCPVGSGNFVVTVGGQVSGGAPFTVRSLGSNHIYFTATTGSDSNAGTATAPFKTITNCKNKMSPGDICYIMSGVVQSSTDNFGAALDIESAGTAALPYAIVGYPGANPLPQIGGNSGVQYGIRVPDIGVAANYWTFANIHINVNSGDRGVHTNGGSHDWRFIGSRIECPQFNAQAGCFQTSSSTNIYFFGNEVTNTGVPSGSGKQSHSVYFSTDTNHVWVGWNHIHDNFTCRAIQFHSSPVGSGTGNDQFDLHVFNNVIHGDNCDGINFATVDPSKGTVEAYNNVIYHTGLQVPPDGGANFTCIAQPGIVNAGPSPSGTIQVYNNTLSDCDSSLGLPQGFDNWGALGNNAPPNFAVNNNIVYELPGERYIESAGYYNEQGFSGSNNNWFGAGAPPSQFTQSLNVDPLFVNRTGGDYHLQQSSPMIGKGIVSWTGGAAPAFDIEGKPRSNPPSVGAFEFSAGSVVPLNPPTNLRIISP